MTQRKDLKVLILTICLGLLLMGCATSQKPPGFADRELSKGATAPHPGEIERETSSIVVFPVVFPPELLVECMGPGWLGTWKILGIDVRDPKFRNKEGFAYFKRVQGYEKTPWGTPLMEAVFLEELKDSKYFKFLLANRDGMVWLFSPTGRKYSEEMGYDSEKFENDLGHRAAVFSEFGMTLQEIFVAYSKMGLINKVSMGEIKTGSQEWESWKKDFSASLPNSFVLAGGKKVVSANTKEEIQTLIKTNPRLTGWQRFLDDLNIPIYPSPEIMAFAGISQLINHSYREWRSEPEIKGYSANATTKRKDLAPYFKWVIENNKKGGLE